MVISKNSQLGLMMDDVEIQRECLMTMIDDLNNKVVMVENAPENEDGTFSITMESESGDDFELSDLWNNKSICDKITLKIGDKYGSFINNEDSKLYLICDGVEKCSKMIKMGDNFSSRALRNVSFGKHTYLLGKNEMTRFICAAGAIKGIYWNREKKMGFEYGFDLESDGYYFPPEYSISFNKIAKIITFVELGDIEVVMLEKGRNNNKPKNNGKVTNTSNFTVYVVDSSWNQLIIRTEGFAVMGHFRLQPCGAGLIDRKLIWINAFEKHGYKRRPKAEIIH